LGYQLHHFVEVRTKLFFQHNVKGINSSLFPFSFWIYTQATSSTPYTHTACATLLRIIDTDKRQKPKGKHAEATAAKKDEPDKQEINTAAKKDDTELKSDAIDGKEIDSDERKNTSAKRKNDTCSRVERV
jgi:hypothetical protein